jgi:hypothetical protein
LINSKVGMKIPDKGFKWEHGTSIAQMRERDYDGFLGA